MSVWSGISDRSRLGFGVFAAHILTLFSIATSNILLGLSLLFAPWTADRGHLAARLRRARPLLLPLGVYALLLLISILFSYDPSVSWRALSDLFNFATPILAIVLIYKEGQVRFIVRGLILLGVAVALYGIVQYSWLGGDDLEHRIQGPFSHYMTFAGIVLLADCLLLTLVVFGRGWRHPGWWAALVTINGALVLSYTRNAWVAVAVVVPLVLLLRAPRLLLIVIPVVILLVTLAPPPLVERAASIVDLDDPSNYDRLCMTYAGAHMVAERPFFGLGPGMVSERYTIYRHPSAPRYWVPHLHSSYLNLAAERGLTSLLVFFWILGAGARECFRRLRGYWGRLSGGRRDLYLGVLVALLSISIASLFEDYWADTEVQRVFLFLLALPFCLPQEDAATAEVGSGDQ